MASRSESAKQTSRVILVIASLLVLSALGYFATKYFGEKEITQQQDDTIEELTNEIYDLEDKILSYEVTLEDRTMQLAEKDKLLEEKYIELDAMVQRVNMAKQEQKANLSQIRALENRIEELRVVVDQYKREIDYLKAQNQMLVQQVDSLQESESELLARNQDLQARTEATTRELEETRSIASALKIKDFRFINLRKNGKEDEDDSFRRWRMHQVRVCFTVMENRLAEYGDRDLYLVYEGPDRSLVANFTGGYSGKFMHQDEEKVYSAQTTFRFDQSAQEVCIDFLPPPEFKFEKGPQYITLYSEGKLIGQGNFLVK
jgi:myosin heavy subunit